ncbi:thiamine monophosphate synthase/TENI family protein [Anoxybacillus sp. B7M1]|jgi:thiazole tautomerase (transcriptional regulator TenI)|uniref:thiazole tautomerase TenI n=1 Tax=unclassified Anoxybacillus TaxID=2639704 RepID=UPI0005CD72F4|nr:MULTISPECIES: thiazole tautomerase TenI [unclassified Anoxybacillus]ANB55631.1 thiamine monophosphate synthase/TENI family protein [Anoxybacillus sp. B2M1]ANB62694.1 thiamine monophosphate synthase/TENI family protein [Anoxybacillus sp. B7M1]
MKKALHVISTGTQSLEEFAAISSLIHSHVDAIHIREKNKTAKELVKWIEALLYAGVPAKKIIVNDRVDVAVACGVKGVQLAYHSLSVKAVKAHFPSLLVGCSIHSLEEGIEAEQDGADYCIYGHVFPTECKAGIPARGVSELQEIAATIRIPVIAIGGIQPDHVSQVWCAGAAGVAVMSGVFLAKDPLAQVRRYAMQACDPDTKGSACK